MQRACLFNFFASVAMSCITDQAHGQGDEERLSSDITGKFEIRAALIEQTDSAARLHTADGRKISVPTQRLSLADQDYLKSLKAPADNPFGGGKSLPDAPPAKSFATAGPTGGGASGDRVEIGGPGSATSRDIKPRIQSGKRTLRSDLP